MTGGADPATSVGSSATRANPGRSLVAIVGPTATGKSLLGIRLAIRLGGEVISCDSTAVYRGFDVGADKVPVAARCGIPHHLLDVAEPTDEYSAARYAREAAQAVRDVWARGRLPVLVGGTGLYYRALTRGLFPGPGRDPALRLRLDRIARRRGSGFLHRLVCRVDPASGRRIQRADTKRLIRALEVYFLTGRPLSDHFASTVPPLGEYALVTMSLNMARPELVDRIDRRVEDQFRRGLLDEVRGLLARGVPETARPFTGLVYRQVLEHLLGVRDEEATRALIARDTRRYARRQLIWFRKEPNLVWIQGAGESSDTLEACEREIDRRLESEASVGREEAAR